MTNETPKIASATGRADGAATATAIATVLRPLPEEHPFYEQIGRVAALWARLEHILDLMIWELADGARMAAISCVTGQIMGPSGKFRALAALCELRGVPKDVSKKISKLAQPVFQTSLKRNRIVHDAWFTEETDSAGIKQGQFRSQTSKPHSFGFEDITEAEIDETIKKVRSHIELLSLARAALSGVLTPSR